MQMLSFMCTDVCCNAMYKYVRMSASCVPCVALTHTCNVCICVKLWCVCMCVCVCVQGCYCNAGYTGTITSASSTCTLCQQGKYKTETRLICALGCLSVLLKMFRCTYTHASNFSSDTNSFLILTKYDTRSMHTNVS